MYYILSLKHTQRDDAFITFWRPNDAGYTQYKSGAGLYKCPAPGHHDSRSSKPVLPESLELLWIIDKTTKDKAKCLPNTKEVWARFGVEKTKDGLERLDFKYLP